MNAKQPASKSRAELVQMRELKEHERAIRAGMQSFIEIGRHLGIIKRDELYKVAGFSTFAAYAEERFDLSRQHAYRIIDTARIALILSPNGDKIISEYAARELLPVSTDREKLRAVFDEATRRSDPNRLPAATLIRDVREELFPDAQTIDGTVVDPPADRPALVGAVTQSIEDAADRAANRTQTPAVDPPVAAAGTDGPVDASAGPSTQDAPAVRPDIPIPPGPTGDSGRPESDHRDDAGTSPPGEGAVEPQAPAQPSSAPSLTAQDGTEGSEESTASDPQPEGGIRVPPSGTQTGDVPGWFIDVSNVDDAVYRLTDREVADVAPHISNDLVIQLATALGRLNTWVNELVDAKDSAT